MDGKAVAIFRENALNLGFPVHMHILEGAFR